MKDMLSRIIEIDKQAQKIMDQAQQEKINSISAISKQKKQMKEECLQEAQRLVEDKKKKELAKVEKESKKIADEQQKKLDSMNKIYRENSAMWVKTIVKQTIEG